MLLELGEGFEGYDASAVNVFGVFIPGQVRPFEADNADEPRNWDPRLASVRPSAYHVSQRANSSTLRQPRLSDGDFLSGNGRPTGITPTGL